MQSLITNIKGVCTIDPSFLLIGYYEPTNSSPTGTWDDYLTALQEIADADATVTFVNIDERMGSIAPSTTAGLLDSDLIHPTAAGHQFIADAIAQTLNLPGAVGGDASLALNDLSDVTITSVETGDGLHYDGSGWANGTDPFVVDAGTPTYDDTDPSGVSVTLSSKWGIDSSGEPYFNALGVTSGEEAALIRDPDSGTYLLRSYSF
jgi:hypothetical protein